MRHDSFVHLWNDPDERRLLMCQSPWRPSPATNDPLEATCVQCLVEYHKRHEAKAFLALDRLAELGWIDEAVDETLSPEEALPPSNAEGT